MGKFVRRRRGATSSSSSSVTSSAAYLQTTSYCDVVFREPKSGVSSAVVQKSPSLIGKAAVSPAKTTKLQSISKTTTGVALGKSPSRKFPKPRSTVSSRGRLATSSTAPTSGNAAATVSSPAAEKLKRKTATGGGAAAASRSMRAPSSGGSRLLNGRTTATSSAASGLRAPVTSLKPKSKVPSTSNISNKSTTTTTTASRKPLSTVNKPSSRQSIYATATKATARTNVNNKPTTASRYATTNNKLKRQQPVTFATLGIQTDEDVDALTGTEANSLRKELDELKQTLHAKEVEHETERETLMKDVSELRTELENLKQSHEEEIERLQEMHREEVEKNENLQVEVEDAQGKVMEFEVKLHKMVEPRLKELLKPYQNAYEECQSLKSVLDIKNEETRKLQKENAQHRLQLSTNTNLQNFVEKLKHQKEGVDAQLQRLQHEYLSTRDELGRVQMSSSLVERKNDELMREVEEMSFKLNSPQSASMLSSQMSPFNPVFTYSTANTMVGDSRIVKQLDMDDTGESTTNNFGA